MSYVQMVMGTATIYLESRMVSVVTGSPAPIPVTGYTISSLLFTQYGRDFYMEYKEVVSALVPPT